MLRELGPLVLPLSPSSSEESSWSPLRLSAELAAPLNLSDVRTTRQHATHLQLASLAFRFAAFPLRLSCSRSFRMASQMSSEQ